MFASRLSFSQLSKNDAFPALKENARSTLYLPKQDGGRGCTANGKFSFASRQDSVWKELLDIAHEVAREAWRTPEADMPGFVPFSRGRCEYRP